MNRKFVKENKTLVKEFIGSIIKSIIGNRAAKNINNMIDSDPQLRKTRDDFVRLNKQLEDRFADIKKDDPEYYDYLVKKYKVKV
tara:strand:- start:1730 stop:1981 length:252 start_codon:yes stop_codon:yes gene_type:complete